MIHFFLSACFRTEQSTVEASLFAIINNDIMVLHAAQCIPGKWLYQFRFHRMLTWVYTLSGKIHYKKRHIYYFHHKEFYTTLHRIQFDGIPLTTAYKSWAALYIFVRGFRIRACIRRGLTPWGLITKIIINQIHLYTFGGVLLSRKGRRGVMIGCTFFLFTGRCAYNWGSL